MSRSLFFGLPLLVLFACGSDDDANPSDGAPAPPPVCAPGPAPQKPAAACDVTIELPPIPEAISHVRIGSQVTYCTNPPSSGHHYPIWAAFKEYDHPIEWPYLVHSMEHGAVLLLYKCDAACPEIVDGLRRIRDGLEPDPLCAGQETPRRIIIAPAPTLDVPVAAAAWDGIYKAACLDEPSLGAFVREHYAKGPENFCTPGQPM